VRTLRPTHNPLGQRHRRNPLGRLAGQEPGLHFGYQVGELITVCVAQLARPSPRDPDQSEQSPAFGRCKPQDMVAGQQSNLGDRDQLEDGKPTQTRDVRRDMSERAGNKTAGHTPILGG
jgi:hypothetical protein